MSAFEVLIAIYLAVVPPALGVLFWGRFNRLESRMDAFELKVASEFSDVRREIAGLRGELGSEIGGLRGELGSEIGGLRGELGSEIGGLRGEMHQGFSDLRKEIAGLRSDITQVALAVGARPRASEA